jgi:hypothetical protein
MKRIIDLMKIVKEKNDYISDFSKSRFAFKVQEDKELYQILQTKAKMSVDVENRFVDYLEELVSQFLN